MTAAEDRRLLALLDRYRAELVRAKGSLEEIRDRHRERLTFDVHGTAAHAASYIDEALAAPLGLVIFAAT